MKYLVLTLALLLAACGTAAEWKKPGASTAQRDQALRECEYEATKATAGIINSFEAGWMQAEIHRQCMEVRGYRVVY